jgi:hypothetical protein
MASPGVSTCSLPDLSVRFFRFGVSTFSSRFPYCSAQLFWENQSAGRPGSPNSRSARLTDILFQIFVLLETSIKHLPEKCLRKDHTYQHEQPTSSGPRFEEQQKLNIASP